MPTFSDRGLLRQACQRLQPTSMSMQRWPYCYQIELDSPGCSELLLLSLKGCSLVSDASLHAPFRAPPKICVLEL
jgi:hypothetical protein